MYCLKTYFRPLYGLIENTVPIYDRNFSSYEQDRKRGWRRLSQHSTINKIKKYKILKNYIKLKTILFIFNLTFLPPISLHLLWIYSVETFIMVGEGRGTLYTMPIKDALFSMKMKTPNQNAGRGCGDYTKVGKSYVYISLEVYIIHSIHPKILHPWMDGDVRSTPLLGCRDSNAH